MPSACAVAPCGVERDAGRGSDFVRAVGREAGPVDADESLQGTGQFVGELTRRVCWWMARGSQAAAKGVLHVLSGTGQRCHGRSLGHRGVRAGPMAGHGVWPPPGAAESVQEELAGQLAMPAVRHSSCQWSGAELLLEASQTSGQCLVNVLAGT